MMIPPATTDARVSDPSSPPPPCSQKQERRTHAFAVARMMGLETAAAMLGGKAKLADALAISVRALTYKLAAERGISNLDLKFAAQALDAEAQRLTDHARKLREACAGQAVSK
jgi:hypothetical protein